MNLRLIKINWNSHINQPKQIIYIGDDIGSSKKDVVLKHNNFNFDGTTITSLNMPISFDTLFTIRVKIPPNIYLFKVNNRNARERCEICLITIHSRRSGVFIVNFEHISSLFLVFL